MLGDQPGDGVRHHPADRTPGGDALPDERRGDADRRHLDPRRAVGGAEPAKHVVDCVGIEPGPGGDRHGGQLDHPLGALPAFEPGGDVGAHHEGQHAAGKLIRKQFKRTVGERRAVPADLDVGNAKAGNAGDRGSRHLEPDRRTRLRIDPLVRRRPGRHQDQLVEPERRDRFLREQEMAEMRRVEGPAEDADRRTHPRV
jgi:hypothetical protein